MSIEAGIIAYLQTKPSVTALAGKGTSCRIRGGFLQQEDVQTGPSIAVLSGGESSTMSMAGATGIASATIQLDCWANSYGGANSLAKACWNVLSGFHHGFMGDAEVSACFVQQIIDVPPDISPELKELNMFGRRVEALLWFYEQIPTFA